MSLYSHSAHSKFSMPWSHWPTSSPVMVSSPPHKWQVTSCQSLQVALAFAERLRRWLKCRRISVIVILFFISLLFLSLTGMSIAQSQKIASIKLTLFHFFYFYFYDLAWQKKGLSCWLPKTYARGGAAAVSPCGTVTYVLAVLAYSVPCSTNYTLLF